MTGTTTITYTLAATTGRDLTQDQLDEAANQMASILEGLTEGTTGSDQDEPVDVTVKTSHAPNPIYDTSPEGDTPVGVADVLREHLWSHTPTTHCSCSWQAQAGPSEPAPLEQWLAHVAGELTTATEATVLSPDTTAWLKEVEDRIDTTVPARVDAQGWGYNAGDGDVWTSVVVPDPATGDASLAQEKVCQAHPMAAPFIAHARDDLPRAIELIRNLTALLHARS